MAKKRTEQTVRSARVVRSTKERNGSGAHKNKTKDHKANRKKAKQELDDSKNHDRLDPS